MMGSFCSAGHICHIGFCPKFLSGGLKLTWTVMLCVILGYIAAHELVILYI